jgi:hypothetical protein
MMDGPINITSIPKFGNREGQGHVMYLEVDGNVILFLYLNVLFLTLSVSQIT